MKTIFYKTFFIVFISFFTQSISAQDSNWSVNSVNYQYSMTFTTFLNVNGTTLTSSEDKVAAFVNGEIRGVSKVEFVASANKYVAYLIVYGNTDNETINFKIYNSGTDSVVNIEKTEVFSIDANLGGIFQSYSIANPELNKNATFNSFKFLGIASVVENISSDKIAIVLPKNTNLSSLKAVFDVSINSQVFFDGILQTSGSSANDFTDSVIYKVLSENEASFKEYEVFVSSALNNNPTTVVISSSTNLNSNLIPVSLDITFSKVVSGFEKSDIVLENAIIAAVTSSDSQNYKVDIVPLAQGDFSVLIPASISLDVNNNSNEASNELELKYDISKPLIGSISIESDSDLWWFLVHFNEDVVNVDVTDFQLMGMASSGLGISEVTAISTTKYKVYVSNSNADIGVISLQLKSTSDIKDKAENPVVLLEFEAYFKGNTGSLSNSNFELATGLSLFPNPATTFFKVRSEKDEIDQILLYDLNGKKVFEKSSNQKEIKIDIQKLKAGVYFAKIISNGFIVFEKIIKK